ncbi:MAG: class I SAM-dependent methyltransferase [Minisyncoccia bacterium]
MKSVRPRAKISKKKNFVRQGKAAKKKTPAEFWNDEYQTKEHFALSTEASEDLEKFVRFIERNHNGFPRHWNVLDVACGNARNGIFLAEHFTAHVTGFDISKEAIAQGMKLAAGKRLRLNLSVGDLKNPLPVTDESQDIVLDMMSSHILNASERVKFLNEVLRVLKPGGWFFVKTFLRDGDVNAERMIRDFPAGEEGSYLHPRIGYLEHAGTEVELNAFYGEHFDIEYKQKSHKHFSHGKPNKRRFIVYYLTKHKN